MMNAREEDDLREIALSPQPVLSALRGASNGNSVAAAAAGATVVLRERRSAGRRDADGDAGSDLGNGVATAGTPVGGVPRTPSAGSGFSGFDAETARNTSLRHNVNQLRHRLTQSNWTVAARKILFSSMYQWVYLAVIIVQLGVLVWTLVDRYPNNAAVFLALEFSVNALLLAEIVLHYISDPSGFWRKKSNVADIAVLAIAFAAILVYIHGPSSEEESEEVGADLIIVLRYVYMLIRLATAIKNQRKRRDAIRARVDFSTVATDDLDSFEFQDTQLQVDPAALAFASSSSPPIGVATVVHGDAGGSPVFGIGGGESGDDDDEAALL